MLPSQSSGLSRVAVRDRNGLVVAISAWGDAAGHDGAAGGRDSVARGVTVDGRAVLPDNATRACPLPAEDAQVVLTQNATCYGQYYPGWSTPMATSTQWTFRSADARFRIGLDAQAQAGSTAGEPVSVTAQYAIGSPTSPSGITWTDAEVTRTDKGWQAVVDQSAAEGAFVSLRVTAADADGNAVTQTVVRAYRVR